MSAQTIRLPTAAPRDVVSEIDALNRRVDEWFDTDRLLLELQLQCLDRGLLIQFGNLAQLRDVVQGTVKSLKGE